MLSNQIKRNCSPINDLLDNGAANTTLLDTPNRGP